MAMAYESKKLNGCQRKQPTHDKIFYLVHWLETCQQNLGLHNTKVYMDIVSLKYFEIQVQMSVKPLRWHDTLALMKVDLIHKLGCGNVVLGAQSTWEKIQAMSTVQVL